MKKFLQDKTGARIFSLLFAPLYIIIIIAIIGLVPDVEDYVIAEREYEKLRKYTPDDRRLITINRDYAGWIRINGTNINYPIVQTIDNTKYQNTTFRGVENTAGAIFLDSRNIEQFEEPFVIIHGNNPGTESMFGILGDYSKSDFMRQHNFVTIYTIDGEMLIFQVFAAFATTLDNQLFTMFDAEEDYIISFFESTGAPAGSTHFIVLSAPTSDGSNERTVVFAAR